MVNSTSIKFNQIEQMSVKHHILGATENMKIHITLHYDSYKLRISAESSVVIYPCKRLHRFAR